MTGYRTAQTQSNDSFFVRAQFDRFPHGKGELSFRKGDILHVTETFYKGQLGVWRASIVNDWVAGEVPPGGGVGFSSSSSLKLNNNSNNNNGGKLTKGKIPSRMK